MERSLAERSSSGVHCGVLKWITSLKAPYRKTVEPQNFNFHLLGLKSKRKDQVVLFLILFTSDQSILTFKLNFVGLLTFLFLPSVSNLSQTSTIFCLFVCLFTCLFSTPACICVGISQTLTSVVQSATSALAGVTVFDVDRLLRSLIIKSVQPSAVGFILNFIKKLSLKCVNSRLSELKLSASNCLPQFSNPYQNLAKHERFSVSKSRSSPGHLSFLLFAENGVQ